MLEQCLYVTHSARECFEKVTFKKNKKFNFKRLYRKDWGKFRELTFSEISFHFVQKEVVFCTLQPYEYTAEDSARIQRPVLLPVACRAQRVNDEAVRDLNLLFLSQFDS